MFLRHYLFPSLAVLLIYPALSPAEVSVAENPGATVNFKPIVLAKGGITLEQAAARVKRKTGGRILSADVVKQEGRKVYRIKVLLPSGNVRIVIVSADGH